MIISNVKRVIRSDESTENYHTTSALQSILASFSRLFWFYNFTVLVHFHCSQQPCFQKQQAAVFSEKFATCPTPNCRQSKQLPSKQSGAFSSSRARE